MTQSYRDCEMSAGCIMDEAVEVADNYEQPDTAFLFMEMEYIFFESIFFIYEQRVLF